MVLKGIECAAEPGGARVATARAGQGHNSGNFLPCAGRRWELCRSAKATSCDTMRPFACWTGFGAAGRNRGFALVTAAASSWRGARVAGVTTRGHVLCRDDTPPASSSCSTPGHVEGALFHGMLGRSGRLQPTRRARSPAPRARDPTDSASSSRSPDPSSAALRASVRYRP